MAKKRKRIELMQSREKEVVFGDLSVDQFRDLVFKGANPEESEETKKGLNKPLMREQLLKDKSSEIGVDKDGNPIMKSLGIKDKIDGKADQQMSSAADSLR